MRLDAMRYKNYIWPHNPETYSISYQRKMAVHKIPYGRYVMQDLGLGHRIMQGEGEFAGAGAYDAFKQLASVFYEEGAGILYHPVWQTTQAYFVSLELAQKPLPDYVRYRFSFWEQADAYLPFETLDTSHSSNNGQETNNLDTGYHIVKKGECLWTIANHYGLSLATLLACNPHIKNPNLIYPGEQVRVR